MRGEPGAERVRHCMDSGDSFMHIVNIGEFLA